jgi:hypothetical protein
MYIAYTSTRNDNNDSFSVNDKGHEDKETPIMGNDSNAISVGIVYAFSHQLIK